MAKFIKWRVQEAPTGRYRSFERRGWPIAYYADGSIAAQIKCEDDYKPRSIETGDHRLLKVNFTDYSVEGRPWRRLKIEFKTLDDAKLAFENFIKHNPKYAKNFD